MRLYKLSLAIIILSVLLVRTSLPVSASNTNSVLLVAASAQYLNAVDSADLDIAGDVTLELWVKFNSLPARDGLHRAVIINKGTLAGGDATGNYGIEWCPAELCGVDTFRTNFRRTADNNQADMYFTPVTGTWYRLATSRNAATGEVIVYEGANASSTANTAGSDLVDNAVDLTIGIPGSLNTDFLCDCTIDEVRVFNSVRTPTQIDDDSQVLLNGDQTESPGLEAYYMFDGSSLQDRGVVTDPVGTGPVADDLTNNNSATFPTDVPFVGGGSPEAARIEQIIIFE